jgi:O-6-methylguanine DNA methyltransferase
MTYRDVATRAGSPRASRAVGNILAANRNPRVPCHRVIRSDGSVGGYNRGKAKKLALLRREGWKEGLSGGRKERRALR